MTKSVAGLRRILLKTSLPDIEARKAFMESIEVCFISGILLLKTLIISIPTLGTSFQIAPMICGKTLTKTAKSSINATPSCGAQLMRVSIISSTSSGMTGISVFIRIGRASATLWMIKAVAEISCALPDPSRPLQPSPGLRPS